MRVIAGEFRGRRLDRIEGTDIRPTSDKVKEALFSILGNAVIDCSFLDLFGGSGGIGIEALSRGAKHVVFIDADIRSIKVLKGNLRNLNITDKAEVFHTDYSTAISKLYKYGKLFDIIFIDPPYGKGFDKAALEEIYKNPILKESGLVIVEHDHKDDMPQSVGSICKYRTKHYGNTLLSFYGMNEETQHKEE